MPKALCLTGMVIAILLLALFSLDLIGLGFPFGRANWLFDLVFVICSAALGYLSWTTLKEQG